MDEELIELFLNAYVCANPGNMIMPTVSNKWFS